MTTRIDIAEKVLQRRSSLALIKLAKYQGITVNLIKPGDSKDDYDDVYGMLSGRSTDIIVKSTNESFTFSAGTDDVLTLAINEEDAASVTFSSGVQTLSQIIISVNAVFSGLAKSEGTGKLVLTASKSIDIKASSTALTVLGLTAALISNTTRIDAMITGDEFTPFDAFNISRLVEGFLYDPSGTAETGDLVDVMRDGLRIRQFKLMEHDALGSTRNVINRFRIAAVLK